MRIFTQYTTERGTDVLQDFEYTFDPQGNITTMKDEATQTLYYGNNIIDADRGYTYDALYRLIEAEGREHIGQVAEYEELPFMNLPHPNDPQAMRRYSRSYEYDDSGNITQMAHTATGGNWTRDYSYTSGKNRLASTVIGANTVNYTHDNNGNIESLPNTGAVTWDSEDRIKEVDLGGGGTAYYTYNAEGQRVRKVIHNNQDIKIKETIYLDGYELYHEFASGSIDFERETVHIMDDQTMIAMAETKTVENGNPVATPVTRLRYQISDHLGSGSIELSETGAIISFEEYYPYGGTSFHSTSSSSQVSAKRYRYNGKEKDEETNLYYYGARYYISWLGRWMSCDPIGEECSGLNLYRYASNNPVIRVDPTGMKDEVVDEQQSRSQQSKDYWDPESISEEGDGEKDSSPKSWDQIKEDFMKEIKSIEWTEKELSAFEKMFGEGGRNVKKSIDDAGIEVDIRDALDNPNANAQFNSEFKYKNPKDENLTLSGTISFKKEWVEKVMNLSPEKRSSIIREIYGHEVAHFLHEKTWGKKDEKYFRETMMDNSTGSEFLRDAGYIWQKEAYGEIRGTRKDGKIVTYDEKTLQKNNFYYAQSKFYEMKPR